MIDSQFLSRTLVDLVRIDSTNPSLSPGSRGEAEIGDYIARVMQAIGLQVMVHPLAPQRVNVVGILKGTGGGKSLLLNAHMDTVGVEGMPDPFSGEIHAGRVFGRGSQDMKGSLAAMIAAGQALQAQGVSLKGDLILACVADEEHASLGTEDLIRRYQADAAIVTEPTDLAIGVAHRGFAWFEVETIGRAAHGSRYLEGIDAILHMGRFLASLDRLERELRQRPSHPYAGPPSLHASTIQGGSELSIYPAHCRLSIERRTTPGETPEAAAQELQNLIAELKNQDPQFQATLRTSMYRSPFEIDPASEFVALVEKVAADRLGKPAVRCGASFWTDAALLAEAGIPTLLLGPVGAGLHSPEEWVDLQSTIELAEILRSVALEYCN